MDLSNYGAVEVAIVVTVGKLRMMWNSLLLCPLQVYTFSQVIPYCPSALSQPLRGRLRLQSAKTAESAVVSIEFWYHSCAVTLNHAE